MIYTGCAVDFYAEVGNGCIRSAKKGRHKCLSYDSVSSLYGWRFATRWKSQKTIATLFEKRRIAGWVKGYACYRARKVMVSVFTDTTVKIRLFY